MVDSSLGGQQMPPKKVARSPQRPSCLASQGNTDRSDSEDLQGSTPEIVVNDTVIDPVLAMLIDHPAARFSDLPAWDKDILKVSLPFLGTP